MQIMISRPQKKRKAQPGGEASSAAACAIGIYVSLDAKKTNLKELGLGAYMRDPHLEGGPPQVGWHNQVFPTTYDQVVYWFTPGLETANPGFDSH
jgi:hypothetical protein